MPSEGAPECVVCSSPHPGVACRTCSSTIYCSPSCQMKDSQALQASHPCLPYSILHEQRCGRLLIAARDIEAGEVIFHDTPAAVGPDNNPKPVCLTCFKRLPGLVYRCRHCSWPLCSPHCQLEDGPHARECSLFQLHNPRLVIEDYKATCPSYNAVMVLRILWLRDNRPEEWKLIDMLMDHLEDDRELTKTKKGVLEFIRGHCKLVQFSEKEILHVMGVIDTNAYIIGENATKDVDLQGLFPITSILNHSCAPNSICFARDDFTFSCRAVVAIKKGEELTTNYLHYHYHYFGLSYRRPELEAFWHFSCACRRCKDSTEFGTWSDSLLCPDCREGRLTPLSEKKDSEWVCGVCYSSMAHLPVTNIINKWWNEIENAKKYDVRALLLLLEQVTEVFDPAHYYAMEIKRRVIENIGETKGFEYEDLAPAWLEKKVKFCKEHLALQQVVAPGLSEYRAYMSAHLAEPLYLLAKKRYVAGEIKLAELQEVMEEVARHLLIVIEIWGPYRRRSSERLKAEGARALLETVDSKYLHRSLVDKADAVLEEAKLATFTQPALMA